MEKNIKVKLTTDLTKYAEGLIAGIEGITVGRQGIWSRGSDRFITVSFPGIAMLDVLWNSLEIVDEEVIQENERQKEIFVENLKTAQDVTLYLGPKGGFRSLSYSYFDKESGIAVHTSVGFKEEAYKIIDILKTHNIPIKQEIMK